MATSVKVACLVVMCMAMVMVMGAPIAEAITCGEVSARVAPCINYLRSGGAVPRGCCNGVKSIVVGTLVDRQTACNCLKGAAKAIPGYNDKNAVSLPGKCRIKIPYKFSISTNCGIIQ